MGLGAGPRLDSSVASVFIGSYLVGILLQLHRRAELVQDGLLVADGLVEQFRVSPMLKRDKGVGMGVGIGIIPSFLHEVIQHSTAL